MRFWVIVFYLTIVSVSFIPETHKAAAQSGIDLLQSTPGRRLPSMPGYGRLNPKAKADDIQAYERDASGDPTRGDFVLSINDERAAAPSDVSRIVASRQVDTAPAKVMPTTSATSCKAVKSCREAVILWCSGYSRADGDGDGIPCENVCKSLAQVQPFKKEIGCER